jgi:hypothetical protein
MHVQVVTPGQKWFTAKSSKGKQRFQIETNQLTETLLKKTLALHVGNGRRASNLKNKLRGLSPRANYTERVTAACRWNWCQLLRIEGPTWSAWQIPTAVFSAFWTEAATFQVAPQLYSRGWVDPVPDPLLLKKAGSVGNRTRTSGSAPRNSDH